MGPKSGPARKVGTVSISISHNMGESFFTYLGVNGGFRAGIPASFSHSMFLNQTNKLVVKNPTEIGEFNISEKKGWECKTIQNEILLLNVTAMRLAFPSLFEIWLLSKTSIYIDMEWIWVRDMEWIATPLSNASLEPSSD